MLLLRIPNEVPIIYVPFGKKIIPPLETESIAACMATASSVLPSPVAPKSLTETISSNLLSTVLATAPAPVCVNESVVESIAALAATFVLVIFYVNSVASKGGLASTHCAVSVST